MDPRDPMPYEIDPRAARRPAGEAIDELVAAAGPGSGSPLVSVELRHTGGALGRDGRGGGAVASLPGEFAMFAVGMRRCPRWRRRPSEDLARVAAALRPYEAGHYLNFVEARTDGASFFPPAVAARLEAARDTYDPDRLMQANHEIGAR